MPSDPTAEYQAMVSTYVSVGALAILTWDILDNLPDDYRILFRKQEQKFSVANMAYVLARLGGLLYSLIDVIYSTAPIGHCALVRRISLAFCPISISAAAFLFLLRLRAIYNRDRIVVAIFSILWLALLIGGIFVPVGIKGGPVGDGTSYCEDISVQSVAFYGQVSPLVFDTLVFFAISWRLSRMSGIEERGAGVGKHIHNILLGTNLPAFTRSILLEGQIYYLMTVIAGISCMSLLFSPLVPFPLKTLLEDIYPAIINIMACRVFRRTKAGLIRESELASSTLNQKQYPRIQVNVSCGSSVDYVIKEAPYVA